MIMLYNLHIVKREKQSQTNIFGTRMLLTLGKQLDSDRFIPFSSIKELIDFKEQMRSAHKGNVPITLAQKPNRIEISDRLIKSDSLSHDPNIGALSIVCAVLKKLGWKNDLVPSTD
ncbi:hypothetical protein AGMMS49532_01980 [Endomicrobiia bacterium]|nr:hypothetical protein AGMMS49532_01980 [Endomicrobiia bacterium]